MKVRLPIWIFISFSLSLNLSFAAPSPQLVHEQLSQSKKEHLLSIWDSLPLTFEKNQGQMSPRVEFISRGPGYEIRLGKDRVDFILQQSSAKHTKNQEPEESKRKENDFPAKVGMHWLNGLVTSPVEEAPLPGRSHYFHGSAPENWITDIPNSAKVRYPEVYPGIDLLFYGSGKKLEYDFVVSPYSDPKDIVVEYSGVNQLSLDEEGNLHLHVGQDSLVQKFPVIYQNIGTKRKRIPGKYKIISQNRVGFEIAEWDKSQTLVIDPVLVYATYFGGYTNPGGYQEQLRDVAIDSQGNMYGVGQTESANFPNNSALQSTPSSSNSEIFVFKISADGSNLIYSALLGGSGNDLALGVAIDSSGAAFVGGQTRSNDFPLHNPLESSPPSEVLAGFLFKLNPNGNSLEFSTYIGQCAVNANDACEVDALALDPQGNVYITGWTEDPAFPVTTGVFQPNLSGSRDAFISKILSDGSAFVFSTFLGGSGIDIGYAIELDNTGNIFVAGETHSNDFTTVAPVQNSLGGTGDGFIAKLNSTGTSLLFSTYLGGSASDTIYDLALDTLGFPYVTGLTVSSDFPTLNPYQANLAGEQDAFITKLQNDGSALVYSSYLGTTAEDRGTGIVVDILGQAIVYGMTRDSVAFPQVNPLPNQGNNILDLFVTKFNSTGNSLQFSTTLSTGFSASSHKMAQDNSGNIYLAGKTNGGALQVTPNALQPTLAGGPGNDSDAILVKIDLNETPPPPVNAMNAPGIVVSPYWQTGSGVYSFISITHPSLSGMNSQIGITVSPFLTNGTLFHTRTSFTIDAGETHRLFLIRSNHPSIGPNILTDTAFLFAPPTAAFIGVDTSSASGYLKINSVVSDPSSPISNGGYADATMLNYWGAIVFDGNNSGFTMEFIGDLNDSSTHPNISSSAFPSGVN